MLRFSLVRTIKAAGRWTTRGAGAIDLCQACWERDAAPLRRARPRRMRKAAAA